MLLFGDHAACRDLRVGHDLINGLDRSGGHTGRVKRCHARADRWLRHGPTAHKAGHCIAMGIAARSVLKTLIARKGCAADQGCKFCPDFINLRRDHQVAVG